MKTTELECRPGPRESEIQKEAYAPWQELGCPAGGDRETWFTAKDRLRQRVAAAAFLPAHLSALEPRHDARS